MSDVYSDDYRAARELDGPPAIPPGLRRAAGAALFVLLVIGMAVWAWRLGTRDAADVPIIRAMESPARVQPEEPGGLQASHQGLEVNSVLGGIPAPVPEREAAPRVVPPPVALQEEDGPQGELVLAVPDFPTVSLSDDGGDLRMPVQEEGPAFLVGRDAEAPAPDTSDEVAALVAAALGERAEDADDAAAAAPGPRPRGRPAGHVVRATAPASAPAPASTEVRTAAASPAATPAASPATAPARPAPAAAAPAPPVEVTRLNPGTRLVQLGAFDSEAMARQTWGQLVGRHGDLLGSKSLYLERATHNARVFYRLRVAGFQNTDQTRMLCESLRARGVDCIPVTLN
jgi:hypothetical protein